MKDSTTETLACMKLFNSPIAIINIGLEHLVEPLRQKGVPFVHIDWHPPASGNKALLQKIMKLTKES
jgi:hypothetical protein